MDHFKELGEAMVRAADACGIAPGAVRALAPGVIKVDGTGVSVTLAVIPGRGQSWVIREGYEVKGSTAPPVVTTVAIVPETEHARAAKCAILVAIERRIDLAVSVPS